MKSGATFVATSGIMALMILTPAMAGPIHEAAKRKDYKTVEELVSIAG